MTNPATTDSPETALGINAMSPAGRLTWERAHWGQTAHYLLDPHGHSRALFDPPLAQTTPPDWLVPGVRIDLRRGGSAPVEVVALDPWLVLVTDGVCRWAIPTGIVAEHWEPAK